MKATKIIALILSFILCLGLVSCKGSDEAETDSNETQSTENSEDTSKDETPATQPDDDGDDGDGDSADDSKKSDEKVVDLSNPTKKYDLAENRSKVKVIGRSSVVSDGITCDFTAAGIEFKVNASGIVNLKLTATAETYFTVIVDGVRASERYRVGSGTATLAVAELESAGEHTISVLRQTEPQRSLCVLNSLSFRGTLLDAPADNTRYIEFIGDSITCGAGNLISDTSANANLAIHQDGTQAFSYLTAKALGADYSIVGCSGIGVTYGYRTFTENEFYTKLSYYRSLTDSYVPTRVPDAVVINLGTNDKNKTASSGFVEADFKADVEELIELIRATYNTDVPIIWTYNMMNGGYIDEISAVITALGGESAGLYTCELNRNTEGAGYHPVVSAHVTASETLGNFIAGKIYSQ